LREALDFMLPDDLTLAAWNTRALEIRQSWRARGVPMEARRPELLEALNALYDQRASSANRAAQIARDPELVK